MIRLNKKTSIIITIATTFTVAAIGGYVYQVVKHKDNSSNSSIVKIEDNDNNASSVDASFTYAGYATLDNDKKLITLNFINPSKSKKSLSLEIVADINGENITLAKTDKINPGYKIDSVKYQLNRELPKGNYNGNFVVHFYNDNGEEEIVNSKIAINIYVK